MSLEYWKREKNFRAQDKGYVRDPEGFPFWFLIKRLRQEVEELDQIIHNGLKNDVAMECADVSNILDYIYSKSEMNYPTKYIPEEEKG